MKHARKRCPWCQDLITRKAEASHRCPAKPQTYLSDFVRQLLMQGTSRLRR